MKLNVRCCCQPTKILGTLKVTEAQVATRSVRVVLMVGTPAEQWAARLDAGLALCTTREEIVTMRPFWNHDHHELAVYSEDRPVEFWRAVPGFTEGEHA